MITVDVFVYGTLQHHPYLKEYSYNKATTVGKFQMKDIGFPVCVQSGLAPKQYPEGFVEGLLYHDVRPETMKLLDRYEGAPDFYDKEVVDVKVNDKITTAMMYISKGAASNFTHGTGHAVKPVDNILRWR